MGVHKPLTADGNRQRYCGTWHHNTWLHFNPQASGTLNGHAILQRADGFTWQVCRRTAPSASAPASGYKVGNKGTDHCPSGYNRITIAWNCIEAAEEISRDFGGSNSYKHHPGGCFLLSGRVYWNLHPGRPSWISEPVCQACPSSQVSCRGAPSLLDETAGQQREQVHDSQKKSPQEPTLQESDPSTPMQQKERVAKHP